MITLSLCIVFNKSDKSILFIKNHLQFQLIIQGFYSNNLCKTSIALVGPLSIYKVVKIAICRKALDKDVWQNDVGIILLGLFVPWD